MERFAHLHIVYSVTRFFRCSKCEASPRYSIIAIHSVLKNNMFFKLTYDLKDVLSVCILDVLRCSKCEASAGHGVGFGLGSKWGNPSTNTLKKTKTKIVGAICTLTYSVTRFFRCSKCEASPRYSIIAIHSVLKNNMFFKLIYDLKDVLSVCILDVLRCSKCEASTGHGVGFGLGSKCRNPSTNTL